MKTAKKSNKKEDLKSYRQAVWDYVVEHSDLTPNGAYFVKFHVKNRNVFEGHVEARWKKNYHRNDDRLGGVSPREKERIASERAAAAEGKKKEKREKWKPAKRAKKGRFLGKLAKFFGTF